MTNSHWRVLGFIVVITIIAVVLASCERRQPPGGELYKALKQVERNNHSE